MAGARRVTGEPTWLIHDPLSHRFIEIDIAAQQILAHWREARSADDLLRRVNAAGLVAVDREVLDRLLDFLYANRLTGEPPRDGWRHYVNERSRGRHSALMWLVHNYLFLRVPLVRPQAFLERTLPIARLLASRVALALYSVMGLAGLYLTSRQWDAYSATFSDFFSWEGALLLAVTLALVKGAHELGHAYVAVRHGCHVPTMGLAVILMAPLPYTDVTDAWRLGDRRQRRAIDSAGIKVEAAVAAIALFLWAFLPDGAMRSLAFILSAVGLAASLAINLNPFMRFDGYYLLAEWLGIENLQPRAFELGCWKLRELLFGLGLECPERLPARLINGLVVYAWCVWIYRVTLFVGIALLVYHYFFKVLGVALFAVEIGYFVLKPIWGELGMWYALRQRIARTRRTAISAALAAAGLLLAILPWSTRVEIPAVIELADVQRVFVPRPALVTEVHVAHGMSVAAGDKLVTLASPEIAHEIALARIKLRLAEAQFARRGADATDRADSLSIEGNILALTARIDGLMKEQAELVVRAPFAGRIGEFNPLLHPGRWVGPKDLVAVVAGKGPLVARGYIAEPDLWRVAPGAEGRFVPEHAGRASLPVVIGTISIASAAEIEIVDLASTQAGRIAVAPDDRQRLVPTPAQYPVRMTVTATSAPVELVVRGVAIVEGRAESLLARTWRQTLKVLLREAGA